MRVLITGATGFIGSHLAKKLCEKEFEVRVLVRKKSSRKRILELSKLGCKLCYGDLNNLSNLPKEVDIIFHLAALVENSSYSSYYRVNVIGTENLVKFYLDSNIRNFVFMSSTAAIGLAHGLINENIKCNPVTLYGRSKYETEKLLSKYSEEYGFPVTIVRAPTVYGPGEKYSFLKTVKLVKNRAERKIPFILIDEGKAKTSLCYINNLINFLLLLKNKTNGIFHVADSRYYTMREIVSTVASTLKLRIRFLSIPKSIAYAYAFLNENLNKIVKIKSVTRNQIKVWTTDFLLDISKAKKLLNFNPVDDFKNFVEKTVKWYEKEKLL